MHATIMSYNDRQFKANTFFYLQTIPYKAIVEKMLPYFHVLKTTRTSNIKKKQKRKNKSCDCVSGERFNKFLQLDTNIG